MPINDGDAKAFFFGQAGKSLSLQRQYLNILRLPCNLRDRIHEQRHLAVRKGHCVKSVTN